MKNLWKYLSSLGLMLVACLCLGVGVKSLSAEAEDTGIYVSNGTYTMNGGTISGCSSYGVYISGGTFTMNGGTISGNGYGVYVNGGTFNYSAGTISDEIYLSSGSYISLVKAPTSTLSIRLGSTSSGTRVAYLSGISSLTSTQLSYLNVVNMPSGYKLEVSSGYVVLAQTITNYTVTISAGTGGSVSRTSVSVPQGTTYSTSGRTLSFSNGTSVTATANTGYSFSYWSPSSGTIKSSTTIYAYFSRNQTTTNYTVTVKMLLPSIFPRCLKTSSSSSASNTVSLSVPQGTSISVSGERLNFGTQYVDASNVSSSTSSAYSVLFLDENGYEPSGTITSSVTYYAYPYLNDAAVFENVRFGYEAHLDRYDNDYSTMWSMDIAYISLLMDLSASGNDFTGFEDEVIEAAKHLMTPGYRSFFLTRMRYYTGGDILFYPNQGSGQYALDNGSVDLLLVNSDWINSGYYGVEEAQFGGAYERYYVVFNEEKGYDVVNAFIGGGSSWEDLWSYAESNRELKIGIDSDFDSVFSDPNYIINAFDLMNQRDGRYFTVSKTVGSVSSLTNCDVCIITSKHLMDYARAQGDTRFDRYTYLDFTAVMTALYYDVGWSDVEYRYGSYFGSSLFGDERIDYSSFRTRVAAIKYGSSLDEGGFGEYMSKLASILMFSGEEEMNGATSWGGNNAYGYYDGEYLQNYGGISYKYFSNLQLDKEDVLDTKKYYNSPIVDRKNIA